MLGYWDWDGVLKEFWTVTVTGYWAVTVTGPGHSGGYWG